MNGNHKNNQIIELEQAAKACSNKKISGKGEDFHWVKIM